MNKIIVAPLNWGLGHATRCIPIINNLLKSNFTPVIASDGDALIFLQKEFPKLESFALSGYNITYSNNLKFNLLLQTPKVMASVKKEYQIISKYVDRNNVIGIISDNRFGVRNAKIPSVYITHQVNVLSNSTTFITSHFHQQIIKKFDECWVPDVAVKPNLSGELSHIKKASLNIKFIGFLSRFKKETLSIGNDVLIILSGPEPQRSLLEKKVLFEFKNCQERIVLVRGKMEEKQTKSRQGNITIYNYLLSEELQQKINSSDLIICRSGYSSIMDMAKLGKKVFFIPTPNQTEQEYLAAYLEEQQIAPYAKQNEFTLEILKKVVSYSGFTAAEYRFDTKLFDLFKCK